MLMPTKIGKMVIYLDDLLPIKSHDPLIAWSLRSHNKLKSLYLHYYSIYGLQTIVRILTHLDRLLPLNLHELLITLSCEIT